MDTKEICGKINSTLVLLAVAKTELDGMQGDADKIAEWSILFEEMYRLYRVFNILQGDLLKSL